MLMSTIGSMNRAQLTTWDYRLREKVKRVRVMNEEGRRPLTVHVLRPRRYLGGGPVGILNFNRRQIEISMERGLHDAMEHDCAEEGCALIAEEDDFQTPP